jgi:outer membrane receptor protein involved in Fe transport
MVPTGMIQRIDIVTGGASATYGSDAVAGVVNLILDREFEGLKGDVRTGISQYGDNIEFSPNLTWGTSLFGGKGHLTIGGDISISLGTKNMLSRGWGRLQPGIMSPSSPRAAGVPAQIIANGVVTSSYNASGLIVGCTVPGGGACPLKGVAFGENGSTYNFAPGTITGGTEQIGGGDYGSFENPDQFLRGAFNRWATMARFDYDFGGGLQAYAQFNYGGLMTFNNSFGARVPNFNRFTVYADNPFLPAAVRSVMTSRGITSFQYSASRQVDLKSIASRNRTDSMMGNMGIGGIFSLLGKDFTWDADLGLGLAVFEPYIKNTPRTADFYASAYVVTGPNGQPVCGPVATNPYFNAQPAAVRAQLIANLSPGCVPYNIFGNNVEQNKAANAYWNSASNVENRMGLYTFNLGFTGAPVTLPAGDLGIAFGFDWRRDTINVNNCDDCKNLELMNQNYSTYLGQVLVHEFYGEAEIPILRDLPFIQTFGINAAIRNTEYSSAGNVTTWKVGITWDVDENFRLRGTRSHDIRAPNLNELYNPGSEGNPNIQNKVLGTSGFIKSNTVGNLALKPESGETITGGFVFQPVWQWAEGLSISMDYFYIKMKDIIATVGAQTIMDDYAVNGAASVYAPFVTADSSNVVGVSRINVPQMNLNSQKTGGIDLEFAYQVPEMNFLPGSFSIRALGTWIDNFHSITPTQDVDRVGEVDAPKLAFSFTVQHEWNDWTSILSVKYQSNAIYDKTLVGLDGLTPGTAQYNTVAARNNSINRNVWPEVLQFDTRFAYDIVREGDRRLQAYLNVDNITNKKPPIVAITMGGSPYDLIGRNFKVGMRFRY